MPIIVTCIHCRKRFRVGDEHAGRSAYCPNCGTALEIPIVERDETPTARPIPQPIASATPPAPSPQVHITVGRAWSPGVAALLSFLLPGLGQLYKGQPFNGLAWFVITLIGYICLVVPGIILHLCCIVGASMGDPYKNARKLARELQNR